MDLLSESLFYIFIIGAIFLIITYLVEGIESMFILYSQRKKSKEEENDNNSR